MGMSGGPSEVEAKSRESDITEAKEKKCLKKERTSICPKYYLEIKWGNKRKGMWQSEGRWELGWAVLAGCQGAVKIGTQDNSSGMFAWGG